MTSLFRRILITCCVFFELFWVLSPAFASEPIHHVIKVEFEPSSSFARVQNTVSIKTNPSNCDSHSFYLHAGMKLNRKKIPPNWISQVSNENLTTGRPHLQKIQVRKVSGESCPDVLAFSLDYSGFLLDPSGLTEAASKSEGFVFSGSDYFYPILAPNKNPARVTFDMEVSLPLSWEVVSQGKRKAIKPESGRNIVRWESELPSEEIFFVANRFKVYEEKHGRLSLYAFLMQEDASLAKKYIQTAKTYIDFYSSLVGTYPYEKFALVENSKQTGYGMPSFTLMGSRIIRFPFILHSSYPHEILHNWWGNGVFADPEDGNWSEGLTSYLADHLLLELKGKGAQYRFQEMMKYRSYVNDANEFPVKEFSYRDSMASQAIGYAKLLMVFHMLRIELGKEDFLKGLKRYYANYKYRYAGYNELKGAFESVSDKNLDWFFEQWVQRKGAPELKLVDASYVSAEGRYDLSVEIEQAGSLYRIKLPIAIWKEGSELPEIQYLELNKLRQKFHFDMSEKPQAVRLDPYNEVFRRLDRREVPASIGQTFGATAAAIVFPVKENEKMMEGYREFAGSLIETGNIKESVLSNTEVLPPSDLSLWVLGKNNESGIKMIPTLKKLGIDLTEEGITLKEGSFSFKVHSFVFTLPRPGSEESSITWVIVSSVESIPGLIRKLPHYGKYGYLVFKGKEPQNVEKGAWPSNPVGLQKIFSERSLPLPSQPLLTSFQPIVE